MRAALKDPPPDQPPAETSALATETLAAAAEMPSGPHWKIPKWSVTATDKGGEEPALVRGYRRGPRIDYQLDVFVSVDSYMEIPAFYIDLHFKPGYTILGTFDSYGLSQGAPQRSNFTTPDAFWNKVTLREPSPRQRGSPYLLGYVMLTAYTRVPANSEIFWLARFGRQQRYPERSYGRLIVRFEDPLPEIGEQPDAAD